jgi:hypothetical protein
MRLLIGSWRVISNEDDPKYRGDVYGYRGPYSERPEVRDAYRQDYQRQTADTLARNEREFSSSLDPDARAYRERQLSSIASVNWKIKRLADLCKIWPRPRGRQSLATTDAAFNRVMARDQQRRRPEIPWRSPDSKISKLAD